jgi:nucleoside-diphosphate-sugar epimerase
MSGQSEEQRELFKIIILNPAKMVGPILSKNLRNLILIIWVICKFINLWNLVKKHFTSADTIKKIMMGKYPGLPNIYVPLVDVRDVADAHIKALNEDVESGRYIISNCKRLPINLK